MKRHPLLAFFALTFGLTWGLGACFALFPTQLTAVFGKVSVTNPLFILAVYAPGISAIIVSGLIEGRAGVGRLLGGFLRWRIGIRWYAAIFVGIPMLSVIAMLLNAALARTPLNVDHWYQLFLLGPTGHDIVQAAGAGGLWSVIPVLLGSFLADPGPLEKNWDGGDSHFHGCSRIAAHSRPVSSSALSGACGICLRSSSPARRRTICLFRFS